MRVTQKIQRFLENCEFWRNFAEICRGFVLNIEKNLEPELQYSIHSLMTSPSSSSGPTRSARSDSRRSGLAQTAHLKSIEPPAGFSKTWLRGASRGGTSHRDGWRYILSQHVRQFCRNFKMFCLSQRLKTNCLCTNSDRVNFMEIH